MINEILKHNEKFVTERGYEPYITSKYPDKKIVIVTCMDTRLVELIPAALGIKNGDVKMIKNAAGVITHPFDSTIRSLLVAIYELGVNEIMIIGHTECGVQGMDADEIMHSMIERGITEETLDIINRCGINLREWLKGFDETPAAILETVDLVRNHPLIPADVEVRGYMIDSVTGKLSPL